MARFVLVDENGLHAPYIGTYEDCVRESDQRAHAAVSNLRFKRRRYAAYQSRCSVMLLADYVASLAIAGMPLLLIAYCTLRILGGEC